MVVTLPDQCLTRPCLAESILAIALGLVVGGVDLLVQVQCSIASKTQSAELKSSETLVCVYISGCLMWLVDDVSSWGTTRTEYMYFMGNGSVQILVGKNLHCTGLSLFMLRKICWSVKTLQNFTLLVKHNVHVCSAYLHLSLV